MTETRENETVGAPPVSPGKVIAWLLHDRPVTLTDASQFETELDVRGEERFGYKILRVDSPSVPNAIAALMLKIRDDWPVMPHIYFAWAEGNPLYFLFRYVISGAGDVPPVTREVLRRAEPNRSNRPWVHVG